MRSVEVCFSDDAIRRGEIDEETARMADLNALVRKLFGLGRIPLTLTCTIEGIASTLKNDQDLQYALDMTPRDETLVIRAKSSIPAADLRRYLDAAPPQASQSSAAAETKPSPAPAPVQQKWQSPQDPILAEFEDDVPSNTEKETQQTTDTIKPALVAQVDSIPQVTTESTGAAASTETTTTTTTTTTAAAAASEPDTSEVAAVAAAAEPEPLPANNGRGVDLISVMRMVMADPQLNSLIEAMVDHVLSAPRKNNPLGKALDEAAGIVEADGPVPAAAAAAAEDEVEQPRVEKSLGELANEIAQLEFSASALTGQSGDDALGKVDEDELTDSLTDSFAEIKIPTGPSSAASTAPSSTKREPQPEQKLEQPLEPKPAADPAVDMSQPPALPPYPDSGNGDDDSDDEFIQVTAKDTGGNMVPEQPEMFQQAPQRSVFSGIAGLFGRPQQNPASAPIHVNRTAIELQKELREMGFKVSTPRVAQLLSQYRTREGVINHLLTNPRP